MDEEGTLKSYIFKVVVEPDEFEDGTPAFLSIAALTEGFKLLDEVCMRRLNTHVMRLTAYLLDGLRGLNHSNGSPLVKVYGPASMQDRGPTIAFNVLDRAGRAIPFAEINGSFSRRLTAE